MPVGALYLKHPFSGTPVRPRFARSALSQSSIQRSKLCWIICCMAHPTGGSYSIWAMPKGALAERLQQDIDRLATEHAAPSFQPHVTLLGGTEQTEEDALRIAADLAHAVPAYRIEFDDVSYGSIFHQCVYIRCKKLDATLQAARQSRQAFGQDVDAHYMPHLSLLYSDIAQETRAEVASREQQRLFGSKALPAEYIEVDSISLWYTIGDDKSLKSWRLVKEFDLDGGS